MHPNNPTSNIRTSNRMSIIEKIGLIIFSLICIILASLKSWASMIIFPAVLILLPLAIITTVKARQKNITFKILAGLMLLTLFIFSFCALSAEDSETVWAFGFLTVNYDSIIATISAALSWGSLVIFVICLIAYVISSQFKH